MAKLKVFSLFLIIGALNFVVFSKNAGSNHNLQMLEELLKSSTELITLHVSNRRLTEIEPRFFINAPKIGYVDFSNNSIRSIDPTAFDGVTNLQALNLSYNQIDKLDSAWFPFPKLLTLDLSHNKLTILDKRVFKDLINLKHLNLSGNSIGNIEVETFSHQKKLISLDLSGNRLVTFDFHVFSKNLNNSQKSFVKIYILERGIQSLGDPYLNEHLESLDLSKNQLIELNNFRHENFSLLFSLDINDNKFNCSYLRILLNSIRWGTDIHANESRQELTEADNIHGVHCTAIPSETHISGFVSSDKFFMIEMLLTFLCICSTSVLVIILFLGRKQLFNCRKKNQTFDVDKNSNYEEIFPETIQNVDDENKSNQITPATTDQ